MPSRKRSSSGFTFPQHIALVFVPPLTALVLAVIGITLRFRVIAEDGAVPPRPYANGIYCYWHRCTLAAAWYFRRYGCTILISRSFDGELITRASALLGYRSVRGSSTRGGAAGLLAFQDVVKRGTPAVFTADGPRGPVYQAKIGPVKLAQMTGAPMGSFYLLPERAWVLKSWDRLLIPKPFSRVVISWSRMITAPAKEADEAALEAVRIELNAALERARSRAEAYFAG